MPAVARLVLALFRRTGPLQVALRLARLFRGTGLPRWLATRLPDRIAFPMAMLASTQPMLPSETKRSTTSAGAAGGTTGETVTMLSGCVMQGLFDHVHQATARVLAFNGYHLRATANQHCCGALHAHAGDLAGARELARRNVVAFEDSDDAPIVVNSAGCGAMLRQYGHLLHDDPAWATRAARVAARVRDVSEVLAAAGPREGGQLPLRVTHDPPCHQMHAQRIVMPPLTVLRAIPGLELVPLEDADQCCGSAGIYNLIEPDTSNAVLSPKLARIAETRADLVASGNPGCLMQIGAGLLRTGSVMRAVHPVELLDASYRQSG